MRPRHRVSRAAIELIKRFEGYRRQAAQLPDGRWTIGYGHTLTARQGAEVSEADAEALLVYDLIGVAHAVNEHVFAPITQNQFDALCSFAFNLGLDTFRRSQVLKRLNEGQHLQAACAMELWRKADFEGERIVVDALVRRRAAEKALFLTPPADGWVPAPSPVLRPAVDLDARELIPRQTPAELVTSLEGETVTVSRDTPAQAPAEPAAPPAEPPAGRAVTAAAETVAGRLQALFADRIEEEERPHEARPQADFAPPLDIFVEEEPRPQAESAPPVAPEAEAEPEPALDAKEAPAPGGDPDLDLFEDAPAPEQDLEIPKAPPGAEAPQEADAEAGRVVIDDLAPYEFIPARVQPLPRKEEPSLVWDLVLGLLGLAFFGFGLFWGWTARPAPEAGLVTPTVVAWLAGLAGVGFVVVAVFRLLQRLARTAERD